MGLLKQGQDWAPPPTASQAPECGSVQGILISVETRILLSCPPGQSVLLSAGELHRSLSRAGL